MKKYAVLITFDLNSNQDDIETFEILLRDIQLDVVELNEFNSMKVYCHNDNISYYTNLISNCHAGVWGPKIQALMRACKIYGPYEMI
jgi:hypothetical protein